MKEDIPINDLQRKIKEADLTKTENRIAAYFLAHFNEVCFDTSSVLAAKVGVSDTSIIRFVRTLGYSGFMEFQKEQRAAFNRQLAETGNRTGPWGRYNATIDRLSRNTITGELFSRTISNIEKSLEGLDPAMLEEAVTILAESRVRFIAGYRGTASLAKFMGNKLRYLVPNVRTFSAADSSSLEGLLDMTEADCLLVFSFPAYSEMAVCATEIARKNRARIIAVTDSYTSPIAAHADVVFATAVEGLGFSNSYIAPMFINDLLLLNLSIKTKNQANNMEVLEEYIHRLGLQ